MRSDGGRSCIRDSLCCNLQGTVGCEMERLGPGSAETEVTKARKVNPEDDEAPT